MEVTPLTPCLSDTPHLGGQCPTYITNQLLPQNFKINMEDPALVLRKHTLLNPFVCTRTQMEDSVNLFLNAWYPMRKFTNK
jgi:hypothetical protein